MPSEALPSARARGLASTSRLSEYGLLFALSVLVRIDTFALLEIEFDESVYFLMARAMAKGFAPYTVIWDHKPPGIYAVYYLAITLLGQSSFAVRIFASLAVALSGWLAVLMHDKLRPAARYRLLPGVLVVLMFRKYGGEGANNELFFVPAATAAIYLLLSAVQDYSQPSRRRIYLLCAGALAGVAFWIKFNTALEIQAAGALTVLLLSDSNHPARFRRMGEEVALCALGFLAVAALVVLPFALGDHLDLFRYSVIEANIRHVGQRMSAADSFSFFQRVIEKSMPQWAMIFAGMLYYLREGRDIVQGRQFAFLLAWLLGGLTSALAPGQPYDHYALELTVPLCLGSWMLFEDAFLPHLPAGRAALAGLTLMVLGASGTSLLNMPLNVGRELSSLIKRGSLDSIDTSRWVTHYIKDHTAAPEVTLWVMDGQPLLYHLLGVDPPTRFAFPPFLLDPHFERVTGAAAKPEVERILATKPEWITRRVDAFKESLAMRAQIDQLIAADYTLETTIHNVDVLHRIPPNQRR